MIKFIPATDTEEEKIAFTGPEDDTAKLIKIDIILERLIYAEQGNVPIYFTSVERKFLFDGIKASREQLIDKMRNYSNDSQRAD